MTALSRLSGLLHRLGFDRPKLIMGLQSAGAAFIALLIAWALKLEHPQWAAITVFVTMQPTRGQIIEKGLYRFIGTVTGCAFGVVAAMTVGGNLTLEIAALALWSGFTVFLGSLQRSYRSYSTVLAGYSAILVLVLSPYDADNLLYVAFDRIATVVIGAVMGVLCAYVVKLHQRDAQLHQKLRRMSADILTRTGLFQLGDKNNTELGRINTAAATLQDELLGLLAKRKYTRESHIDHLLPALVNLLFACYQHPAQEDLGRDLIGLAQKLHGQSNFNGITAALRSMERKAQDAVIEEALRSLIVVTSNIDSEQHSPLRIALPDRHRYAMDWKGAWQGGLRIAIVLAIIGAGWVLSGDPIFQYSLASAAICIALTTTGVTPMRKMVDVIRGQSLAATVAIATELLLWQLFPSPEEQLLCLIPACLIFALVRSHRATSLSAPDYAITVFLLLNLSYLPYPQGYNPFLKAFMAMSGGILGYFGYLWIFPTDARVRRKSLWSMIKRDLQEIASLKRQMLSHEEWRLSFTARYLKIAFWASGEGGRYEKTALTTQKAIVTLHLAEVVFMLKDLELRQDVPSSLRRAIGACLARIANTNRESARFKRAFILLSGRLRQAEMQSRASLVEAMAEELSALESLRKV